MNLVRQTTTRWLLLASVVLLILVSMMSGTVAAQTPSPSVAPPFEEYYRTHQGMRILGSPLGGQTTVNGYVAQYFEKGRLEDHRSEASTPAWGFMYGRLTAELLQSFPDRNVSGTNLTYGQLREKADPRYRHAPPAHFTSGTMRVTEQDAVFVPYDPGLQRAPGYLVPAFFWDYLNRADLFPGGWLHDVGLPMSNAFVVSTRKNGEQRDVTIQAFERAVLTYDPRNPAGWYVERANIGADLVQAQGSAPMPTPTDPPLAVNGWQGTVVAAQPGVQIGDYFQRDNGERYTLSAEDPRVRQQLAQWADTQAVQVWGTLTHMPGSGPDAEWQGHINVSRVEVVATGSRNLAGFATASASSTLPADSVASYEPEQAIDGQRATAWVEGVEGAGSGEYLMLTFPREVVVERIGVDVGYDSDATTFYNNNRVKRVAITFSSGYHMDHTFEDVWGVQYVDVTVPEPHLAETTSLKIVITEVYAGERYNDTPIAEVEVWGSTS